MSPPRRSESVQLRGNSAQVSPPRRSESVQLRGDSTGHAPRCRSVRKAFACVARVCRAVKLYASRCRLRPCRIRHRVGARGGCEGLTDSTRARHARGTRERLRTLRGRLANALTTIAGQQLDSARMCARTCAHVCAHARAYARMYARICARMRACARDAHATRTHRSRSLP